ncbi:SprT-like domain-containing protein [Priestia aryabhattai]|uniref:SprT-like domain-containing protein n=1 Tax=Priestia aryabhattai TaxID=412384 RepID=UPI0035320784
MKLDYLKKYAESFLDENYGLSLDVPLIINNRLRAILGAFSTNHNRTKAIDIELSGDLLRYGTQRTILDTLKHELVHYALFVLGHPYRDGDEYFENELKKLNITSTETNYVGIETVVKCPKCNEVYETPLKSVWKNPSKYKATCCMEKLQIVGRKIYDGERNYMIDQVI